MAGASCEVSRFEIQLRYAHHFKKSIAAILGNSSRQQKPTLSVVQNHGNE